MAKEKSPDQSSVFTSGTVSHPRVPSLQLNTITKLRSLQDSFSIPCAYHSFPLCSLELLHLYAWLVDAVCRHQAEKMDLTRQRTPLLTKCRNCNNTIMCNAHTHFRFIHFFVFLHIFLSFSLFCILSNIVYFYIYFFIIFFYLLQTVAGKYSNSL